MSTTIESGPAILIGYEYKLQIEADNTLFPEGATFAAQIRVRASDSVVLATLTTENSGIRRISDRLVEIVIPADETSMFKVGTIHIDMVRTDITPDLHLGFSLEITVLMPVTRGLT